MKNFDEMNAISVVAVSQGFLGVGTLNGKVFIYNL